MTTPRIPSMSSLARSLQRCSISRPATQGRRFINITTPHVEATALPESMITTPLHTKAPSSSASATLNPLRTASKPRPSHSPRYSLTNTPQAPPTSTPSPTSTSASEPGPSSSILPSTPLDLPQSVRENLPYLISQPPYYITIHIYGKPYLVTAGDTIRLPFLMDGVLPGDVLRLNRATLLGSRDWTLKGGANNSSSATITASTPTDHEPIVGNTSNLDTKTPGMGAGVATEQKTANRSHKAPKYLDERLFICRAVVMGTESEPMRVMEKTKQRQRHTKTVKSKHKYTILKIKEIEVTKIAEA